MSAPNVPYAQTDSLAAFPQLTEIFQALNAAHIRYALLRGYDELAIWEPTKEIDLLVHPEDHPKMAELARQAGFVKLPALGYAPHYFYVNYCPQSKCWLKLDVINDMYFGYPYHHIHWPKVNSLLQNRQFRSPVYVLHPADEWVCLLFHNFLDKKQPRSERIEQMRRQFAIISSDPALSARADDLIRQATAEKCTLKDVAVMIESDFRASEISKKFAGWLNRHKKAHNLIRWWSGPLRRKLRPLAFALGFRGVWVALLAPDGGGKSTLSKSLLQQPILRGKIIYMGINLSASTIGLPTTAFLKKAVQRADQKELPKFAKLPLKAVSGINKLLEHWYRIGMGLWYKLNGRTVIFDRFIYDSYTSPRKASLKNNIRKILLWGTCPHADLTLFLDAPGELLFNRKGEHSPEFLDKQRESYLKNRDKIPNFKIVDATQSAEDVLNDAIALIWNEYRQKQNR